MKKDNQIINHNEPNEVEDLFTKVRSKCFYVAGDIFDVSTDLFLFGKDMQKFKPEALEEIKHFISDAHTMTGTLFAWLTKIEEEAKTKNSQE